MEIYTIGSERYCAKCLREAASGWDEERRREALHTLGAVVLGLWAGRKAYEALCPSPDSDDKPLFSENCPEDENQDRFD